MTPEDLHHLRAIGRAAGGLAEIRGAHNHRAYDGEMFYILTAEVVAAVRRAPGDAQRLPGTNLDGRAVNPPGKNALDAIEDLLVGVVLVGRRR